MAEQTPPTPGDPTPPPGEPVPPGGPTPPQTPDYAGPGTPPDKDSRTMAMLCHLLGYFTGFLGPLIIWMIKKDQSPFVDDQGKEALNFQLTVLIALIVSALTCFIVIGFILVPAVLIADLVFCIIGTIQANKGVAYRYPVAIRFIK